MILTRNIRKRALKYLVISAFLIIGGYLAYAQFYGDAYVVKTVHIFPASITADDWNNVETLTFQNLEEYALLQEFNEINSATMNTSGATLLRLKQEDEAIENEETDQKDTEPVESTEEVESQVASTDDSASTTATTTESLDELEVPTEDESIEFDVVTEEEELEPEASVESQTSTTPAEVEEVSEEMIEIEDESVEEESATTTVLRQATSLFRLAMTSTIESVVSLVDEVASTSGEEDETEDVVTEESANPVFDVVTEESTVSTSTTEVESTVTTTEPQAEEVAPEEVEQEVETEVEDTATTTETEEQVEVEEESVDDVAGESGIGAVATTTDVEACNEDCRPYTIALDNFSFPLDENVEITGAQLRMSFAAEQKETRDRTPLFTVQYSVDGAETWIDGGVIVIDDQVSNGINGGYYLFALPNVTDQQSLDQLQVELTYRDDPAVVEDLFVESLWLELFTVEPPEDLPPTPFAELLANDGFNPNPLSGDELLLPSGEMIEFDFTDNNDGETLIIKSNEVEYQGVSEATTYFSVTNTADQPDEVQVQAYFPNGVGEVTNLEVFNQNKPREAIVPEYRPYVYHCEAGWDYIGDDVPNSLEELSREFSDSEDETGTSTVASDEVEFAVPTSTEVVVPALNDANTSTVTTTVSTRLPGASQLLQLSTFESASSTDENTEEEVEQENLDVVVSNNYMCRNTNIIRQCDELDGENTSCRVNQVKIQDHEVTQYAPGWDIVSIEDDSLPEPGFLARAASFIGFGPQRKEVPERFEVRVSTPDTFTIEAGETLYFKMDISFPPFSSGEYWVEAIGDSEYGLLDPFWSSEWIYRMPIVIDNTTGADQTEYQLFFEIDSALTDFWTNVNSDGSDIRFIQETASGNFSDAETALSNWVDRDFAERVPIEIPAQSVDTDLVNFPVSITLSSFDSDFWAGVRSDGGDIRVTNSDGTFLPIDLVSIDTAAETGELHFRSDSIAANAANTFYVYYNQPSLTGLSASDPLGSEAVWIEYEAVYHFDDDPTTIGNTISDVSGNGQDLTVNTVALATTTGQLGTAIDFTAGAGYLASSTWNFPSGSSLNVTGSYFMTVQNGEALYQWGTDQQSERIRFEPWINAVDGQFTFGNTTGGDAGVQYLNRIAQDPTQWHGFATVGTTTAGDNNYVYEDGVLVDTLIQTINNPSNTTGGGFQMGRDGGGGNWQGFVDELRIATSSRDEAWVKAESVIFNDPERFYTARQSQTQFNEASLNWYSTSWEGRQRITIPSSVLTGDVTDFPIYVDLSLLGSEFFTRVASDGRDIRVTSGDGVTELPYELVSINTGGETGELHFKGDLTTSFDNNDFYIYFDNSDALAYDEDDTFGEHNVWTNGFQAVYHFEEDAVGTGNANLYTDSTVNEYHGDDETTSDDSVGRIGGGLELGDTNTDYVKLPIEVIDGLADISVSGLYYVAAADATDERTIMSGASSAEDDVFRLQLEFDGSGPDEFILTNNNSGESTDYDFNQEWGDDEWDHFMVVAIDADDEVDFWLNGIGDAENNTGGGLTISAMDIDANGLYLGQEQTGIATFQNTNEFVGRLDEIRIASTTRDDAWATAEGKNLNDVANFIGVSTAETLAATQFTELDFWVQHFDDTADEADIWVQVANMPQDEETIIWLYYGNSAAQSASDELATFSYSTSTQVYHVVDDSGANQVSVVSLIDNNEVSIDGNAAVPLNAGERTTFTTFDGDSTISVLGPISGTVTNNTATDGSDTIVPISFATTTHVVATNRGTEQFYVHAPFASTTLTTYEGSTFDANTFIATGTTVTVTAGSPASPNGAIFEATSPILVMHRGAGATAQDGLVAYPPTLRDIYGFDSNTVYISATANNPDPSTFCSGGDTGTETGITRGEAQVMANCTAGTQFTGNSLRLTGQSAPLVATQQADSDGNESTVFWPEMEFGTQYALTNDSQFFAVACSPRFGAVDIELRDSTGSTIDSGTCTPPDANSPGTLRIGDTDTGTNNGTFYTGAHTVVATNGVPFYMIFEDTSVSGGEDEKNVIGPVQARKFDTLADSDVTFGAQELANDAEFEQLSYAWYVNDDVLTPTSTWPISTTEFVAEGEGITGAGAVDDGDIMRLRMNLAVSNATGTVNTNAFRLQYSSADTGQCSLATTWFDLGEQGSTTATFSGYNNATVGDGATLSTLLLASSTIAGTYEERNFSDFLPSDAAPGSVVEYDWVIEATNVAVNTNYCFRMVRAEGEGLNSFTLYPEVETVGPPNTPTNFLFFDNEKTTSLNPVLEFTAIDIASDDINYQIQIDDDYNFGSVDLDRNSDDNFIEFENIDIPSDKAPFTSGQRVRFTASTDLTPTTTYWYRVRADDPNGSATSSDWSTPFSFTTDTVITVTEWFQTTSDQFNTNALSGISTTSVAGSAVLTASPASIISTGIDFDDASIGNAWGEVSWNSTDTSGTTTVQVQFNDNGTWALVPDSVLPGNSIGTSSQPISILELDTTTYNEIRLVGTLEGTTVSLQDWTVSWGLRVDIPTQGDPFDNQKVSTTTPDFDFFSTDPQGDDLEYEISFSTDITFESGTTTYNSATSPDFVGSSPYTSGDTVVFNTPDGTPFTDGTTYWWRTRAKDPLGGNAWSPWSTPDAFTVDTAITVSTWFQTTQEQFEQGALNGTIASTSDSVELTNQIGEYGTETLTNNNWTTVNTSLNYDDMVVIATPEYNVSALTDGRTPRIRNKTSNSFEIKVDDHDGFTGSTIVDYIVMEAGEWVMDDGGTGITMYAGTESAVTETIAQAYGTTNNGRTVTVTTSFGSNPLAFASIVTDADTTWVDAHLDGGSSNVEWTGGNIRLALGKHLSGLSHSGGEDIDYILMDQGGGTNNGSVFDTYRVLNDVEDSVSNGGHNFTLSGFTSEPAVTIMQNNSEGGGDGSSVLKDLSGTQSNTNLFASVLEVGAGANAHGGDETVSVLAFEDSAGVITRLDSGSLSGTIASEDMIFSDGAGPKFDNFAWSETSPGLSEITIQMQYLVSEGVYALLPDTEIPNNSSGTSTSPIDLTGVDIDTYPQIRALAALNCNGTDCPTLDDWQLEWSLGVNMTGTLQEYDRATNVNSGTIRAAVNGTLISDVGSVTAGTWSLSNVTAFAGDLVTVWVDGAAEEDEAVAAFVYDGLGDITGVEMFEQHLSISADENATTTNALLAQSDSSAVRSGAGDEDVFFEVDLSNNLVVCGVGSCSQANIYVGGGNVYIPNAAGGSSVDAHDFVNDGEVELDTNTFNISGSWTNNATTSVDTSTINLVATSTSETITSVESPLAFHNLSFGAGAGNATFTVATALDLSGDLTVASGTLDRGTNDIALAGSLTTGTGGFWLGEATTTFDGGSGLTWTDSNPVPQNVGNVIIDGASTFVSVIGDVSAYDVTIGTNDTLAGGSGTIFVAGDWTNSGTFNAETGTVEITVDDRTYPPIVPGSADWYSDTNFQNRIAIVVDDSEVPGTVTNIPLFVDLSILGTDFWNSVQTDGDDIRITSGDGQTELPYDLVEFDSSLETGELHFLADSVNDSATTTFYIYHNNATATSYIATDPFGSRAVWADFEAVYHFSADPTSIANVIPDATGNGYNLVVQNAALATTTGQMGTAVNITGGSGYLQADNFQWIGGNPQTTSGWYQLSAVSNESVWEFGEGAADQMEFRPWYSGNTGLLNFGGTTGQNYAFTPRDTVNFNHFVTLGTPTSTTESNFVYHDTVLRETNVQTVDDPENLDADGLQVGRQGTGGNFNGSIDELRFSTTLRNTDWIETEYNNQNDQTAFYATTSVESYVPPTIIDEATHNITAGGSSFNNLTFNDATTSPAFTEPSVVTDGDFTISTGTVSLPTGVLTIGGDFTNLGFFQHNNAEVEFTTGATATITLNGTEFFNSLYDVTFDGSGTFIFADANATATNNFIISDGVVEMPTGVMAIGGTMTTDGAFDANDGTVKFISASTENITTNGSSFYDVIFGNGTVGFDWYNLTWSDRSIIEIPPNTVSSDLTNFPVYVDMSTLGTEFWSAVNSDGSDIRVTQSDGQTEVPVEVVSIDTVGETGEMHFRADSILNLATSTFYIYYGNSGATAVASTSAFGSQNVWSNGYIAVYHFEEPEQAGRDNVDAYLDSTSNNYHAEDDTNATGTTGYLGRGVEFQNSNGVNGTDTFDHLNLPIEVLDGSTEFTFSAWLQNSDTGPNTFEPTFVSGYSVENELILRLEDGDSMEMFSNGNPNDEGIVIFGDIGDGVWRHYTYTWSDGGDFAGFFLNGSESYTDSDIVNGTLNFDPNGLIYGGEQDGSADATTGVTEGLNGFSDEARFASVVRSDDWIAAEHDTIANPGSFYVVTNQALEDAAPVFTLNEANTDADNDVIIDGAQVIAPTFEFTIGGSALNNGGSYDPNNATTTFDSTDLGETVAFGDGPFYNLSFDGVGGGWTLATNTVLANASLVTGADFVQSPNTTLTVEGIFNNSFASTSTTWTDSTLVLSGGDYTVTERLDSGDDYATVEVSNASDIVIWNSTISTSSIADTSSIYMPDYGLTDGELRIFGNYDQGTTTEYWSYNTDFDGTDISGSPRQVDVRVASGSMVVIESALEIFGDSSASTTIDVLNSGTYELIASGSSLNAQYFTVTGTGVNGFELLNGVMTGTFSDGSFDIASGTSALTVDKDTVEAQPSATYNDFYFNALAGSPFNVTASGTPNGFWLFSGGGGDRYGESFDNDDGDPGAIQWDDSNYAITVSGVVYSDDGVTPETAPVCNGVTQNVTVEVVGIGTFAAACNPLDGSYSVPGVSYTGDPKIVTYLNSEATDGAVQVELMDERIGSDVGTPFTVDRPDVIDNSVLIAMVAKDDDPAVSPPAGWVAIDTFGDATGDDLFTGMWYRVVTDASTEPTSYSFTSADGGEHYHYWIGSFVNIDTTTPIDTSNGWNQLVNDTTPSTPSVTTTVGGTYVLSAWYVDNDAVVTTPDNIEWDYRLRESVTADNNNFTVISRKFSTATTTDTLEITDVAGGRDPHVGTFALNPASSATASGTAFASAVTQTPIGASEVQLFNDISLTGEASDANQVAALGTISVTRPTTQDGDVLVAFVNREDEPTISAPAGWTLIAEIGNNTQNDMYSGVWYRIVSDAASEPAAYNFVSNDTAGTEEFAYWIGSYDNVDISSVLDVSPVSWTKLFNQNPSATASGITTVTDSARVFAAWFVVADTTVDTPGAPWTTVVEDLDSTVGQTGRSLNISTQILATAGATGDADLTSVGTQEVHSIQLALRPTPISVATEIADMDLYRNRVIVRHEDSTPLSIADMTFDNSDDSDVRFIASTSSSPDTLDVLSGSGLYVWNDKEFTPNGEVTMQGGGNYFADGSLTIGTNATFTATTTVDLTIGGSMFVESGGVFTGASSTVAFTATNTAQQIGAAGSSTITFYDTEFTGVSGGWVVQTPLIIQTDIEVATGTLSGISDILVQEGSFTGEGTVAMTGGEVTLEANNVLGGSNEWSFYDLTLGDGANPNVTTRAANATTTVGNTLTIATGHFLDAYGSVWDIQGSGATFIENGTFIEGTSTVRYSGLTPSITRTAYNNLVIDTESGATVDATAPVTGLQVLGNLAVGAIGTSTLDANTNDPLVAVDGDVYIGSLGTIEASDTNVLDVFGSWDNDGVFTANGGTVEFLQATNTATVAAGNSSFANVNVQGNAIFNFTESATATENFVLGASGFDLATGQSLGVGGIFTNTMSDVETDWSGTTLRLFGNNAYTINTDATSDTYNIVDISNNTHPRVWNSTSTSVVTEAGSSLYSMNHESVSGDLYIFGDFVSSAFDDYWSYGQDFDGSALGADRPVSVQVEAGGSVFYEGGSLTIAGSSTATTTLAAQSAGTYLFTVSGTTTADFSYYSVRDTTASGTIFAGSPTIVDISNGDYEVEIDGGSAITVGGTVIDVNPAQTYNEVRLATTTAISANNVTATGTSASAWRFVNVQGNLDGEAFDVDPGGDPGFITWEDSAAIINISGNVYSDEGITTSTVCDGSTQNIRLSINGTTFATTTCAGDGFGGGTGAYTFVGVSYGLGDTLTVYINDEVENAVTVTQDPISSIANFDLYENRVIIKHESAAPMTIADMEVWDSDDDPGDILFDAELTGMDSLTLDADTKLIVAANKEFEPGGDVIIPGGGSGSSFDGTLELDANATFTGGTGESYTIGGSLLSGAGATFDPAQSTTTFTTTGAGRTIDTNEGGFYNVVFTGSGDWTVSDVAFTVGNDLDKTNGALTLPNGTTTVGGSFENSGGTFDANTGTLVFTATDSGNLVEFAGSDAHTLYFAGIGDWSMTDTNATATDSFLVATGTVTLPSGVLAVAEDFVVTDTITNNNGTVRLSGSAGGNTLTLSGNDLGTLVLEATTGDYTQTDGSAAFTGDLIVGSGTFTTGTGTLSIGGSFDATGGTFENSTGTVLFNSTDTGEIVDPGANTFYNVTFAGAGGGWALAGNATSTNNFLVTTGSSFTVSPGVVVYVGGTFLNTLGGTATDWTGTTLVLDSSSEYEVNTKSTAVEQYDTLILGENTDISFWNSAATSTIVPITSSLYSQDNGGVDGDLYIYGDYHIGVTTENWSYATDFDGVALGGSPRAVNVRIATSSIITLEGGTLNLVGEAGATTSIANQGSDTYTFIADSGTFNADYYSFRNLDANGLQFTGNASVSSLDNGDFEQAANTTTLVTLASTTLNANASLVINDTRFATGGFTAGTNVSLDATTTNSWTFTGDSGDLWGEDFDVDGTDQCSSIRWDDSSCLLTEQNNYRWRNDDGGEGAAPGTWYDEDWSKRKRVRVINADAQTYTNVPVKLNVTYDADMQSDFDDLRFTDSTGTVAIDYWLERFTTASEADVWVEVPTLATSSVTELYMYYGNVSTSTDSDASEVFNVIEDFEDNTLTEYAGETSLFAVGSTFAFGGGFGLDASPNTSARANFGMAEYGLTFSQGEIIRYMQYVDTTAGSGDEACLMFAVQDNDVTDSENYAVCLEQFGTDRVSIVENVENTDSTGTLLGSSTITFTTGWYEVEIDWQTSGDIDVSVFDSNGSLQATTTANDTTYTSGDLGFTFWFQNGGWDSIVSYDRIETTPTTFFGVEQEDGGASWAGDQNTPTGGFAFGQTARLRMGVENTGLPIENQNFQLEFAPKGAAPVCEAVDVSDFVEVPTSGSCGLSEICMTTSASTTNGDPTTDHLVTDAGQFVVGEIVADSSNQTGNIDVDQNQYTELEYAINLTLNAVNDSYCFRVTDDGDALDSYANLPELTLAFDPVIDTVVLNDGFDISLTPGTTTVVIASTTVTDFNGFSDLASATTTFYTTSATGLCTPDNNNCYIASGSACTFTGCSGASCTLNCSAEFQFHADPTDTDAGEEWFALVEVSDVAGGADIDGSIGVELLTLRALEVNNAISYGTVDVSENTGSFNPNVTLNNIGNEPIDVQIAGTDMTDGVTSIIPASQQLFATSTFTYTSCVACSALSVTGVNVEVDLDKPLTDSPAVSDEIYWGIEVPFGTASNPHDGLNTFTAISD